MEKLVFSNIDNGQEAMREQHQLVSNWGTNIGSAQQLLAIVRNKKYRLYLRNASTMIAKFFDTGFTCDGNL